ncbi:helix-turn-helix domain-containing protein [Vibrio ouci]|uniref:Helix-turn-helix domain-containing protein n=1 Tax=Vibrio ouci TaxID=2499078 RepID=A0A4Y8W9K1_9VIBR|nr:helix-turn-helix domain-containing protein [Vibrio ouci]TFH89507.1 helix-turn-helix domain-containing protein [Vibrio ouci]
MSTGYHYTECGLPNVYLKNGYTLEIFEGEEYLSIDDMNALHTVIGSNLATKPQALTGAELRFLRETFNHSRRALGDIMGVDQQTVGRWEKGESAIPKTVDLLMRQLFLESIDEDSSLRFLLEKLADSEAEAMMYDVILEVQNHQWLRVVPA